MTNSAQWGRVGENILSHLNKLSATRGGELRTMSATCQLFCRDGFPKWIKMKYTAGTNMPSLGLWRMYIPNLLSIAAKLLSFPVFLTNCVSPTDKTNHRQLEKQILRAVTEGYYRKLHTKYCTAFYLVLNCTVPITEPFTAFYQILYPALSSTKQEPGWTWYIGHPIEFIIRINCWTIFWLFGQFWTILNHLDQTQFLLWKNICWQKRFFLWKLIFW